MILIEERLIFHLEGEYLLWGVFLDQGINYLLLGSDLSLQKGVISKGCHLHLVDKVLELPHLHLWVKISSST
jgi:hypothetical protein